MTSNKVQLTDEVISALNEELAYQTGLINTGKATEKDHGIPGRLVTLSAYTRKAEDAWVNSTGDTETLDVLRKCAAIAIRGLIEYGCPRRKNEEIS